MNPSVDRTGFKTNAELVFEVMQDGGWHTLEGIAEKCGIRYPSSVASRIRDFASLKDSPDARPKDYCYERQSVEGKRRVYEYRLLVNVVKDEQLPLPEFEAVRVYTTVTLAGIRP